MEREEDFKVAIKVTGMIHVDLQAARAAGISSERYTTPLHVLDLIFRQGRAYPDDA